MGPDSRNVVTLANSIIGVGILAMPYCFQKCGILLSILLLLFSNLMTRLSCHYLAKASILSRRRNYEYLAFYAFGSPGKIMVELCIIGYLFGTSTAYNVVVGDLSPQIISQIFNINHSANVNLRLWTMVGLTIFCVLPLGFLKDIDSLSVVCTASIGFYFCFVVKVIGESLDPLMSNDGWINRVNWWQPGGVLQCLPIFSMSLSCQLQLFEVSETMPGVSLDRMNQEVKSATLICTIVYIMVGFFGYVAFCFEEEFSGNILMNLTQSLSSDVIKVGFIISVAFSFPLVIFPCRASVYSLLYRQGHIGDGKPFIPEGKFRAITVAIVLCSLLAGLVIPSVELVIGLVGSTIGIAICIIFPSCCFAKVSKKDSTEKWLAKLMIVCGFCLMILGTYSNLNAIDAKAAHNAEFQDQIATQSGKSVNGEFQTIGGASELRGPLILVSNIVKEELIIATKDGESVPELNGKLTSAENKKQLSKDAIKKEEEELSADPDSKAAIRKELSEVVDEIKRQNEETQRKVDKLVKIVEKIENKETLTAEIGKEAGKLVLNPQIANQVRDKFPKPIPLMSINSDLDNNLPPLKIISNNTKEENNSNRFEEANLETAAGQVQKLGTAEKDNDKEDDVEAIRRELLNIEPFVARVKRDDCKKEI